jgi:hemerythrin
VDEVQPLNDDPIFTNATRTMMNTIENKHNKKIEGEVLQYLTVSFTSEEKVLEDNFYNSIVEFRRRGLEVPHGSKRVQTELFF